MEYASGGELFDYLVHERRFSENKVGQVSACHAAGSTLPTPACHQSATGVHQQRRAHIVRTGWVTMLECSNMSITQSQLILCDCVGTVLFPADHRWRAALPLTGARDPTIT